MSGRERSSGGGGTGSNPMGRLMDKLKRSVSEQDEHRDPLQRGYSRVDTAEGSLSTSSTATSLDTVLIDNSSTINELTPVPRGQPPSRPTPFTAILESDEATSVRHINEKHSSLRRGDSSLKTALKSSKVSFEQPAHESESDEDSFEDRRGHFQQTKAKSADHRGILKDLNHLLADDDRKAFQSKKHVSLDIKHSKILEKILRGSSSDEEFEEFQDRRKQFQSRKHKSLDARVKFNLDKGSKASKGSKHDTKNDIKEEEPSTSSSESEYDTEGKRLYQRERIHDFSKPIVIDIKDLELSEEDEEDYISARESFQKQKSLSCDSRRSHRFFEMDDLGGVKGENIRTSVPFVRQITQDGKPKLEVYRPTTNPIYINTQIMAAIAVSLGSMIVGFSSGYTSPALPSMKDGVNSTSFEMTENQETWIGSIMPLAGLFGGIAGGPLIEYLGRKNTILGTGLPFAISWLLIGCAANVYMVLAGRALSGFCIGIASLALPVYLGETVQPEVRGTLGLLPTAFGNTGILIAYGAGIILNWSNLAFLGCSLALPFIISMLLIPETPRWYVSRNKEEHARKALQWLRGKQADVEPELKGILKTHHEAERHASSNGMAQLFKKCNLKPLSISLGLMLFQQLSGINAVIFYAVAIFKGSGSDIDSNVSSMLIGVVNFAATFIATCVIDRFGRKLLLYISSVGMIITLGTLGGYFFAKEAGTNLEDFAWIPLASLMMYVLCFSLGFGPIPWLMMGEILPAKIRGNAASVATGFNWSITFIVTKTFGSIVGMIGLGGVFIMFCAICVVGLFFVIFCVPETQGKSLEDIERKMMGRVRRMSSVANIRPLSFNM